MSLDLVVTNVTLAGTSGIVMREQLTIAQEAHRLSKSLEALNQRLSKQSASRPLPQRATQSAHASSDVPDLFKVDISKYNPSQARDSRGRFAAGGGGGARRSGGALTGNPFLTPSQSPAWWPTMARDLTAVGVVGTAIGVVPVVALGVRGFSRTILRGLGPVAYRMAQKTGRNVVSVFHGLARQLGFKIPRGAMRGVPRARSSSAWQKMPKGAKKVVDDAVTTINRARRKGQAAFRTARPKRPK
jgi:hypothetical protein